MLSGRWKKGLAEGKTKSVTRATRLPEQNATPPTRIVPEKRDAADTSNEPMSTGSYPQPGEVFPSLLRRPIEATVLVDLMRREPRFFRIHGADLCSASNLTL
jgi:hypothetical protein